MSANVYARIIAFMTTESVSASGVAKSKAGDRKIMGIFVGAALLLFALLSLVSVGIYYWYKNSGISRKITEGGQLLVEELSKASEEGSDFSGAETPESTSSQDAGSGALNGATGSTNNSNAKSTSSVELKIDYGPSASPGQIKTCYKYTIYEGPFRSSKCYSNEDYFALSHYVSKYEGAELSKESAESTIKFTCNKEYFKVSCENAREQRDKAEKDMERYSKEINQIIARGW